MSVFLTTTGETVIFGVFYFLIAMFDDSFYKMASASGLSQWSLGFFFSPSILVLSRSASI
jgi:hypothetical protein